MASNRAIETNSALRQSVVVSSPATPTSGQAVRWGTATGVAMTNKGAGGNGATFTSVDFGDGFYNLSVKGVNDGGNSAVTAGDPLFFVDGDAFLSKKVTGGYFFGIAFAAVGSGSTTTIMVLHMASPGAGTLAAGGTGTAALANNAVTAAKLTTTLATGFIPLVLSDFLVIATNDIVNTAHVSKNTDPILERANGATDKATRLSWASGSVLETAFGSIPWPADLDATAAVVVKLSAIMKAASVDTPVIAVSAFEGIGGTNLGGNTPSLSTTLQTLSVSLTVTGYPGFISISLKPGTHSTSTNDVYVYGAWLEYTRK